MNAKFPLQHFNIELQKERQIIAQILMHSTEFCTGLFGLLLLFFVFKLMLLTCHHFCGILYIDMLCLLYFSKAFGINNVQTAKHYGNLGRLYQSMRKYKVQLKIYLQIIQLEIFHFPSFG